MGYVFEELIPGFSEQHNETAGEHFTPREVIELMLGLFLEEDSNILAIEGKVIKFYDPACGAGDTLSVAQKKLQDYNSEIKVIHLDQELNPGKLMRYASQI